MTNNINLKPNFELLNSNFDGYKLKTDPNQTVHTRKIENGIFQRSTPDATCYLYTRMESLHNHIIGDPFETHTVYLFNKKGHLMMFTFTDGYVSGPVVVWQEDLVELNQEDPTEANFTFSPSVLYPSSNLAVTSNGCGVLNVLQTGDRSSGSSWLNLKELKIPHGSLVHSLLIDAPSNDKDFEQDLHVLLLSVVTPEQLKSDPLHANLQPHLRSTSASSVHIVYWFTLSFDGTKWEVVRERRVAGLKSLDYLSLDHAGEGLVVLSHDSFYFIYDSKCPLQEAKKHSEEDLKSGPKYIFSQNNEEIKLWLSVGTDITSTELRIDVRVSDIKIAMKDDVVLEKKFLHPTDSYAATWKLESGHLEVCVPKAEEDVCWHSLFEGGDVDGEQMMDDVLVAEVHQRLAHLTSEQWNSNPDPDKPAFNPGQLEACDDASEDLFLAILDGTTHLPSHSAHLGAVQHLCNVQPQMSAIPAFCLRHDVDGILWQLNEDRTLEHTATFHAFGYVKASKSMAKFTEGAPDNSYVAVADVNSHVYVFCQPGAFGGELRNRKSGKVSTTIARQLVISLRNHDQVMGFHAAPNCIFILTHTDLFVYTLHIS